MVPCVGGQSLAWIPSSMSCSGGGHMQIAVALDK